MVLLGSFLLFFCKIERWTVLIARKYSVVLHHLKMCLFLKEPKNSYFEECSFQLIVIKRLLRKNDLRGQFQMKKVKTIGQICK